MKTKSGFMLRTVGERNVVVAVGQAPVSLRVIIPLNSKDA